MSQRLTLAEAAEYLHVPANTLRWWRTCGTGPVSYTLNKRVFFDLADLDAWVSAQKSATARGGAA